MVYGLALRLTSDGRLAEEILLEAFVAAWSGLGEFRHESRFSTWICAITANRARLSARAEAPRRGRFRPLVLADERAPAEASASVEDRLELEQAIARLPAGAREAFLLRHLYGFSCAETAVAMSVSVGTVKSQTARACALLRERLTR